MNLSAWQRGASDLLSFLASMCDAPPQIRCHPRLFLAPRLHQRRGATTTTCTRPRHFSHSNSPLCRYSQERPEIRSFVDSSLNQVAGQIPLTRRGTMRPAASLQTAYACTCKTSHSRSRASSNEQNKLYGFQLYTSQLGRIPRWILQPQEPAQSDPRDPTTQSPQ